MQSRDQESKALEEAFERDYWNRDKTNFKEVRTLIELGISLDLKVKGPAIDPIELIFYAVKSTSSELRDAILKQLHRVNVNIQDQNQTTLFMYACGRDSTQHDDDHKAFLFGLAQTLLEKGCNPYVRDLNNHFALTYAMQHDMWECGQWLLDTIPTIGMSFASVNAAPWDKPGLDVYFKPNAVDLEYRKPFDVKNAIFLECTLDGNPLTRDIPAFAEAKIVGTGELIEKISAGVFSLKEVTAFQQYCLQYLAAQGFQASAVNSNNNNAMTTNSMQTNPECLQLQNVIDVCHEFKNKNITLANACLAFFHKPENEVLKQQALSMNSYATEDAKELIRNYVP